MFNFDNTLGYEPPLDVHNLTDEQTAISIENLNLFYGQACTVRTSITRMSM